MPRRIESDHKDFRDVVSGRIRKSLKKYINTGKVFRKRSKNGKVTISIPRIDIPRIVFGDNGEGIGRGLGKEGDVIGKDPQKGKGNQAGDQEGEGILINLDLEDVLHFLQDELKLPNIKPKPNETFQEVKIKYNNIALTGPESLRHNRRTMLQALKRMAAGGELDKLHYIPGFSDPVRLITPINSDRRYKQYTEIKVPASNAVIFFARDGSASMDQYKCDIVSDMSWWIDAWIRHFYERVERCYIWHDTVAQEVDEETFYRYRYGGGTKCSSAMKLIGKQFENRFPPNKWNIYVIYFTDGENWQEDNVSFIKSIQDLTNGGDVNFVGISQVMAYNYEQSLKNTVDESLSKGVLDKEMVRTTDISPAEGARDLSDDERDEAIKNSIIDLLGSKPVVNPVVKTVDVDPSAGGI